LCTSINSIFLYTQSTYILFHAVAHRFNSGWPQDSIIIDKLWYYLSVRILLLLSPSASGVLPLYTIYIYNVYAVRLFENKNDYEKTSWAMMQQYFLRPTPFLLYLYTRAHLQLGHIICLCARVNIIYDVAM